MRVKLSKENLNKLFSILLNNKNRDIDNLAHSNNISERTLRDWRSGKFTIAEKEPIKAEYSRRRIKKLEREILLLR